MQFFASSHVSHLGRDRSDHCPLLVKYAVNAQSRGCFRFLNVWVKHHNFKNMVCESWGQPIQTVGMQGFFQKTNETSKGITRMECQCFG